MIQINILELHELTRYKARLDTQISNKLSYINPLFPKTEGVYFIFNKNDEIIYIGISINIQKRIASHLGKSIYQTNIINKEDIYTVSYIPKSELKYSLEGIERVYIDLYNPKYNDLHREFSGWRGGNSTKSFSELPQYITVGQYQALRNHPNIKNSQDRMLLTLLWETAGHISGVLSLKWNDFKDIDNNCSTDLIFSKGTKKRTIPLSLGVIEDIRQWKKDINPNSDENYLFPGEGNLGHETRQNVQKKMKRWGKLINTPSLNVRFFQHGLVVYLLLVKGLHYKVIAARTGHSNPMMIINTYSVVTTEMQREALKNIPLR